MEAITSEKSWNKIKDLLWLKLFNAIIHTYTLCFMETQQWEKESLAAYMLHKFKTEPKRCNFTNDALLPSESLSRDLKNTHSLATLHL